jgi:hypothetical protein
MEKDFSLHFGARVETQREEVLSEENIEFKNI